MTDAVTARYTRELPDDPEEALVTKIVLAMMDNEPGNDVRIGTIARYAIKAVREHDAAN